jgi:hypothetical protein
MYTRCCPSRVRDCVTMLKHQGNYLLKHHSKLREDTNISCETFTLVLI